ncbi:alkene reductase [Lysinibacillus halotolerans]|uniref:Alkene reductase n=1 Tax=Lysinibacillus halotolerans TaxID=1368476 RepID=A0A3M8HB37_9BACI|nr:alkene reductase [Lysinibacillus halotolerans]RNC99539.1 alkene reductase [Lysinibacillus halotolerans]
MGINELLNSTQIGNWHLKTKIVMAPMTRSFANNETGTVGEDIVHYYRKRAKDGIGLIITEGINPSPRGKGTFGVPGLYTNSQVDSWRKVTEAVHEEGGTIVAQLWHVGRLTHRELTGGLPPQAPSPIKADGLVHRLRKPYDTPEEMTLMDIKEVIQEYALAARNAIKAGFDGVEIHGAHGYLIDQFNCEMTNKRTDEYGGNLQNRLSFMKELLMAVINEVGKDKTIIRFSEIKDDIPGYRWANPEETIKAFIQVFHEVGLQIIHPSTNDFTEKMADDMTFHQLVRKYWDGIIIGVGNLNPQTASKAIAEGTIDLAAFGRPLLANPDFVQKIKEERPLKPYEAAIDLKYLN